MEGINQRISKIIQDSGLSASEFADAIEVPRSSISHIASGRNKPSLDFLIKVKDRFPELEWNWLIKGEGEMKTAVQSPVIDEKSPTSLPDLFSIIDNENFGKSEPSQNPTAREHEILESPSTKNLTANSQSLANQENNTILQSIENQSNKIKKIVMFFENGKFESFEP